MSAGPVLLEVRGLGRRFEPRAGRGEAMFALRELSFVVHEGEFLTIVGPSGSGKSTLLNLIAQIDTPTEGEIRFRAGPSRARRRRRRCGRAGTGSSAT